MGCGYPVVFREDSQQWSACRKRSTEIGSSGSRVCTLAFFFFDVRKLAITCGIWRTRRFSTPGTGNDAWNRRTDLELVLRAVHMASSSKACYWRPHEGLIASATSDRIAGIAPGRLDLQLWNPDKPLVSGLAWSHDCTRDCKESALHAFDNNESVPSRTAANGSYCLGVVLVEPPIPGGECNTDFFYYEATGWAAGSWQGTTKDFNKPRCYQHLSADLGNQLQSTLANEISAANVGISALCRLKVTTLSLVGCGQSDEGGYLYSAYDGALTGLWDVEEAGNASDHSSPQVPPSSPPHPHPHPHQHDATKEAERKQMAFLLGCRNMSMHAHFNGTGWACINGTGIMHQNATEISDMSIFDMSRSTSKRHVSKDVDAISLGPAFWVVEKERYRNETHGQNISWPGSKGDKAKKSTGDEQTPGMFFAWAARILLPLCVLLAAGIVWLHRTTSRRSVNLRRSRDRAQSDLQLLSHQVTRVHIGTGSLPDSLPDQRLLALRGAPLSAAEVSLPPGPSSSSHAQSVSDQEQAATAAPRAAAEADRQSPAERTGGKGAGGSRSKQKEAAPRAAAEADRQSPAEGAGKSKRKQAASVDWVEAYRQQHAKGAGRSRSKQAVHMLEEVPLSWAEADRQFYASAAGKAYLAGIAETGSQIEPNQVPLLSCADRPGLVQSAGFVECSAARPTTVSAPSVPEARSRQDLAAEALADLSTATV